MYTYKHPHPAITADCVTFSSAADGSLWILLIQRKQDPYKDCWAFPGGFMNINETAEAAAKRELAEETGLHVKQVQQIGVYSAVERDPRERVVTIAYMTFVEGLPPVTGSDDARIAQWFPLEALPSLAFDHAQILSDAIRRRNIQQHLKAETYA